MARENEEESPRVMGFRVDSFRTRASQGEEQQHVLGFPVGSFGPGPAEREQLRSLAHPIRAYKKWLRHRRLGAYAIDEEPENNR
jgi:hypothetical protein